MEDVAAERVLGSCVAEILAIWGTREEVCGEIGGVGIFVGIEDGEGTTCGGCGAAGTAGIAGEKRVRRSGLT